MKIVSGTKRSILAVSLLLNIFVVNKVSALPGNSALRANNNNNEEEYQNSDNGSSGKGGNGDNHVRLLKEQGGGGWEDDSSPSSLVQQEFVSSSNHHTKAMNNNKKRFPESKLGGAAKKNHGAGNAAASTFTTTAAVGEDLIVPEAVTCGTNVFSINLRAFTLNDEEDMGYEVIERSFNGGFNNIWDSEENTIKMYSYGLEGGEPPYSVRNNAFDWDCRCVIFLFYDNSPNKGFLGDGEYGAVYVNNNVAFLIMKDAVYCSDFAYCGKIGQTSIVDYSETKFFKFDEKGVWAASRGCKA